ncbi:MAG TPA: hypothetical protein IAA66_09200 [Candidatus Avichristensenella intestinipullorum]|uniref:Uncharacterized protein n=1 Tax=Candidatus Avichristensenella intestinipullorum TaxID=2840693 RepID=A0A9D1CJF0_9FIRM|nr:hypothetical protein [Candidatus Avichristensenella intestinipullorum]
MIELYTVKRAIATDRISRKVVWDVPNGQKGQMGVQSKANPAVIWIVLHIMSNIGRWLAFSQLCIIMWLPVYLIEIGILSFGTNGEVCQRQTDAQEMRMCCP